MNSDSDHIVIHWTVQDEEEAKNIVKDLLECSVIARAIFVPRVLKMELTPYSFKETPGIMVFMKTRSEHYQVIAEYIDEMDPTPLADLVAVPIEVAEDRYLSWIDDMVGS